MQCRAWPACPMLACPAGWHKGRSAWRHCTIMDQLKSYPTPHLACHVEERICGARSWPRVCACMADVGVWGYTQFSGMPLGHAVDVPSALHDSMHPAARLGGPWHAMKHQSEGLHERPTCAMPCHVVRCNTCATPCHSLLMLHHAMPCHAAACQCSSAPCVLHAHQTAHPPAAPPWHVSAGSRRRRWQCGQMVPRGRGAPQPPERCRPKWPAMCCLRWGAGMTGGAGSIRAAHMWTAWHGGAWHGGTHSHCVRPRKI